MMDKQWMDDIRQLVEGELREARRRADEAEARAECYGRRLSEYRQIVECAVGNLNAEVSRAVSTAGKES